MFPYIPLTDQEEREMLDKIGVDSIDDLFKDIPQEVSLSRDLDLPKSKSELEVKSYLSKLASLNKSTSELTSFLGAGAYDHYIPSIIKHILMRTEFLTSYTPYQAEVSQGTLQYIFEFQTLIARLTGMEIANASLYDRGYAYAEAALMCASTNRRNKVVVSQSIDPQGLEVIQTYCHYRDIEVDVVPMKDGETDYDALEAAIDEDTGAVIAQSPNFFGTIEDVERMTKAAQADKRCSMVLGVDPMSLALFKKPGDYGVDVVVGDAQCFGVPQSYGGPYIGFMAVDKKYIRRIPGRIVGQTEDRNGKRSWVLTLSAREQHIRRDKATSNICSNQGLNVLSATIYMALMGKKGMREVAEQCAKKANYCFNKLTASGKYKPLNDKLFFKEFAVVSEKTAEEVNAKLREEGFIGGFAADQYFEGIGNVIVIAVTEKRTKEEIDRFVELMEEA